MRKWNMLMVCILAIALNSSGQNRFMLEGTIGKSPIVMLLEIDKGSAFVTYYYKKYPHDIELEGDQSADGVINVKKGSYDFKGEMDTVYESLQIHELANKTGWEGTWKERKGSVLPIKLTGLKTENYLQTKNASFHFVNDSTSFDGKFHLQWNHETGSTIKSFKILTGYTDSILRKINSVIKEKQIEQVNNFFSCAGRKNNIGDFEYTISNVFLSETLISIHANAFWLCGIGHPNSGDMSFTIDAIRGTEIKELDDLFNFKEGKLKYSPDSLFDDDRGRCIVNVLTKLYPREMAKPTDPSQYCNYSKPSYWNYPVWHFTTKGLYIGPTFNHGAASCEGPDFPIIPYSLLPQYLIKEKQISLPK